MLSSEHPGRVRKGPDVGARVRWLLAEKVSRALSVPRGHADGQGIVQISVEAGTVEPLSWLQAQRSYPRLYWSGRDGGTESAGAGMADRITGDRPEDIEVLVKGLAATGGTGVRYYGGGRFDPARETGEEWEPFGACRFVLPRFELRAAETGTILACNLVLPRDLEVQEEILTAIEGMWLSTPLEEDLLPSPDYREDVPDRTGWDGNVARALASFAEGRLGKVVLARRACLGFGEEVDGVSLARELWRATPGCFHFYVEPEAGTAFVGASPERLYRREGRTVMSEAVAGTRPRGASPVDDEDLRDDLLGSGKDRLEHGFVKEGIAEALEPLCDRVRVEEGVSEMKLASRRHLVSRVDARLRSGVTEAEILEALHPTPAVGGHPKEGAIEDIRALEPFDRGWYAGPIGWVGTDAAEFAVGIRSGLIRGRQLALFSGAGIVAGSTPEGEWDEVEQKIEDFTGAFGLGNGAR